MSMWQFLIQREGDRAWLPIEAGGEIPEGRYRLAARTSYVNTPVVVEIVYVEDAERSQPKIQRRAGQTNARGLLMVFPYSKMPIGTLTVRCLVHTKAALQSHTIQFHILSKDFDEHGRWDDWQPSTPAITKATGSDHQRVLPENSVEKCILDVQLQVTSEALMATKGQSLLVEGHIQLEAQPAGIGQSWQGRLQITLYDPQTTTALVQQECPVHTAILAPVTRVPFQYPVLIPDQVTTHVLLAELALRAVNDDPAAEPLATASLVVTVNWQDLLTLLQNPSTEEIDCSSTEPREPSVPEETVKRPLDLTFVSMLNPSKAVNQPQPVSQPVMTTVKPSSPKSEAWQSVTLPTFPRSVPVTHVECAQEQDTGQPLAASDELLTMIDNLANLDEDDGVTDDRPSLALNVNSSDEVSSKPESDSITPEPELDAVAPAFRSLNLHQRFWTRLHNLVGDVELANWLAPVMCPDHDPAVNPEDVSQVTDAQLPATASTGNQPDCCEQSREQADVEDIWLSQEIVVDDDFCLPDRSNCIPSSSPPPFTIPDDQPIPEPVLHVPEGEWIAGKSIPIRITIPDTGAQLCVKQWFFDYETRSVLG
ncbi:MAG: hypothetical protein NZ772_17275, partial [Cyanobacteria bacterium]|nr:hypothetical protein [Cyanobacteriota bacterium]MDW8203063.1 hypothetical protein [Cyanobacteriota bacterium SKYGB_h_bin112]